MDLVKMLVFASMIYVILNNLKNINIVVICDSEIKIMKKKNLKIILIQL